MVLLRQFWTPCYWYDDIRRAITPIAFYTAVLSLMGITYTSYVMNGGDSSQFYMPYFETDVSHSAQIAGALGIIFFIFFLVSSLLLVHGVRIEIRGLLLPWISGMSFIILYQIYIGIHWLLSYYIYLDNVFAMVCMWIFMGYNIYCLMLVYSYYQILRDEQEPQYVFEEMINQDKLFYWDETV